MQVYDALRAFDYLAARPDVDPSRIGVIGKFNGGVVALLAPALEPKFRKLAPKPLCAPTWTSCERNSMVALLI